jgi:hypothetical protein
LQINFANVIRLTRKAWACPLPVRVIRPNLATLCDATRGQKDLDKFARGLSRHSAWALGIRRNLQGKYPAPTEPTFCRLLQRVDASKVEQVIVAIQEQVRSPAPKDQLIVLDGKEPKHASGASVLSAVTLPSQHYLGSAVVDQKTNEIPVARELFKRLELEGRFVSLDALHAQDETARAPVREHGAEYLQALLRARCGPTFRWGGAGDPW